MEIGPMELLMLLLALGGQILYLVLVGVVVYLAVRLALAHDRRRPRS
jgi:hypothetical protein